jgi:hypothetical protein
VPETMHGRWTIGVVSVRNQSREHSSERSLRARNGIASARTRFASGQEGSDVVTAIAALRQPGTAMGGVKLVAGFRSELWRQVVPDDPSGRCGRLHPGPRSTIVMERTTGKPDAGHSVAQDLRALGVKGVLVQMAERGQLMELRCEMPQCYCPKGRAHFDPRSNPMTDWAPNPDHYPVPKWAGGHLLPDGWLTCSVTGRTTVGVQASTRCWRRANPWNRSQTP